MVSIVLSTQQEAIGCVTLNHAEKHNCLNPAMIHAITAAYRQFEQDVSIKAIVLTANGKNFCAGADLQHMEKMKSASHADNVADARAFADFFNAIYVCKKPTLCVVHGKVLGGGIGLMAAHDIVVAADDVAFSFPEVKIGLMPATIAPFVAQRIGFQHARRYMLSAETFSAQRAQAMALVDHIGDRTTAMMLATTLTQNNLDGMIKTKAWLQTLFPLSDDTLNFAATLLASMRCYTTGY